MRTRGEGEEEGEKIKVKRERKKTSYLNWNRHWVWFGYWERLSDRYWFQHWVWSVDMLHHWNDDVFRYKFGYWQWFENWVWFWDQNFLVDGVWLGDGDVFSDMFYDYLDGFSVFNVTVFTATV